MKFIIMRSGFGDYWVGKTELKLPDDTKSFDDYDDAQEEAMTMCDQCENRDEVESVEEGEVEEITSEEMWKWLA